MQQVLEIVDSESIGADELKKITRISSGLFQNRLSVPSIPGRDPTGNVTYENDGVKVILRQKISMTFDTSFFVMSLLTSEKVTFELFGNRSASRARPGVVSITRVTG